MIHCSKIPKCDVPFFYAGTQQRKFSIHEKYIRDIFRDFLRFLNLGPSRFPDTPSMRDKAFQCRVILLRNET